MNHQDQTTAFYLFATLMAIKANHLRDALVAKI
jgi:hypothetical protein